MLNEKNNNCIYANISGVGSYVPPFKRTNYDLEKISNTNDEWIYKRTGIKERRILSSDLASSDMAVNAIQDLLSRSNNNLNDLEVMILATSTPDMPMPPTSNIVCKKLNCKNVWAFDINSACSGFLYALNIASNLIQSGSYKNILVVATDNISKYVNIYDRSTNILFGDGAGAVWLKPSYKYGIIDSLVLSNGDGIEFLNIKNGGSLNPITENNVCSNNRYIYQEGKIVFKKAIKNMGECCKLLLNRNGYNVKNLNWLIPHQANRRIIEAIAEYINLDHDKSLVNIEKYGNTVAATIPICLSENVNLFRNDDLVMFTAFGAGFSWGSILIKWEKL